MADRGGAHVIGIGPPAQRRGACADGIGFAAYGRGGGAVGIRFLAACQRIRARGRRAGGRLRGVVVFGQDAGIAVIGQFLRACGHGGQTAHRGAAHQRGHCQTLVGECDHKPSIPFVCGPDRTRAVLPSTKGRCDVGALRRRRYRCVSPAAVTCGPVPPVRKHGQLRSAQTCGCTARRKKLPRDE